MGPERAWAVRRELVTLELTIAVAWAELLQAPAASQPLRSARLHELETRRRELRERLHPDRRR